MTANSMKCLAKLQAEQGIWMHRTAIPPIGPNDLLIQIQQTAICGTDMHIYRWDHWSQQTIPVPMTIGHEYMGVVAAIGEAVSGFSPGDRVSGEGHITCGYCRNCRAGRRHLCRNSVGVGVNRPGAFAEYLALPAINAFKLPDGISDDIATIFDPLGNAVHTALSHEVIGEDVLITGAGPIGAMAAAITQYAGAKHTVITDSNPYRLALAKCLGATRTVNITQERLEDVMQELDMHEGFDVCLEMSGSETALGQILQCINHGGKIAVLGIPSDSINFDLSKLIFKGLTLKGIYGREMFETWYKMASLVQAGLQLDPIITHRFPVDDFQQAFEVMDSGEAGKVILDWRC